VDVVVLIVARIGNPQDFVDIIAVDEPDLFVVAGIGLPGAPGPAVIVIITGSLVAVNKSFFSIFWGRAWEM